MCNFLSQASGFQSERKSQAVQPVEVTVHPTAARQWSVAARSLPAGIVMTRAPADKLESHCELHASRLVTGNGGDAKIGPFIPGRQGTPLTDIFSMRTPQISLGELSLEPHCSLRCCYPNSLSSFTWRQDLYYGPKFLQSLLAPSPCSLTGVSPYKFHTCWSCLGICFSENQV